MKTKIKQDLCIKLGYCGINCKTCKGYFENSEVGCKGCKVETEMISDCPTKRCAESKGFLHCGECSEFPCKELDHFYHDGNNIHESALCSIKRIQLVGLDEWKKEQIFCLKRGETTSLIKKSDQVL